MAYVMQPVAVPGSNSNFPDIRWLSRTSGSTFIAGAVLIFSSGEVAEAGADPAAGTVVGVALQDAVSGMGYYISDNPSPITNLGRNISVAAANNQTIFAASLTNGSSTLIAPALTDVGVKYGITAYSGVWTVDQAKTGGTVKVQVVGYSIDVHSPGIVFFKWLPAAFTS